MPKYRLTEKTTPARPRHRVTGKTSAFLTDFPHPPAEVAKKPPQRKVTKLCKITVERPGEPAQIYHTRSSNEVLP